MSVWAQSWAYEQDVKKSGAKFVLVSLASFADEEGCCYPSQATMSRMTGISERAVRAHLAYLEERQFIRRQARRKPDGTFNSDYFLLQAPPERLRPKQPTAKSADGEKLHEPAANFVTTSGKFRHSPAADFAAKPLGETISIEPSVEPSGRKREKHAPAARATPLPPDYPLTDEHRSWAAVHTPCLLPRVEEIHAEFCDYWHANGKRYIDWFATWRNWLRRQVRFAEDRRQPARASPAAERPKTRHQEQFERAVESNHDFVQKLFNGELPPLDLEPKIRRPR